MATLKELRDERLRKLKELKDLGVNPYPATAHRTHLTHTVMDSFQELEGKDVTVAGRIVAIRKFGKIAFVVVRDSSGSLQLFLKAGSVEDLNASDSQLSIEQLPL